MVKVLPFARNLWWNWFPDRSSRSGSDLVFTFPVAFWTSSVAPPLVLVFTYWDDTYPVFPLKSACTTTFPSCPCLAVMVKVLPLSIAYPAVLVPGPLLTLSPSLAVRYPSSPHRVTPEEVDDVFTYFDDTYPVFPLRQRIPPRSRMSCTFPLMVKSCLLPENLAFVARSRAAPHKSGSDLVFTFPWVLDTGLQYFVLC